MPELSTARTDRATKEILLPQTIIWREVKFDAEGNASLTPFDFEPSYSDSKVTCRVRLNGNGALEPEAWGGVGQGIIGFLPYPADPAFTFLVVERLSQRLLETGRGPIHLREGHGLPIEEYLRFRQQLNQTYLTHRSGTLEILTAQLKTVRPLQPVAGHRAFSRNSPHTNGDETTYTHLIDPNVRLEPVHAIPNYPPHHRPAPYRRGNPPPHRHYSPRREEPRFSHQNQQSPRQPDYKPGRNV